ncbi:hypothetical protein ACJQWK_00190 [Exserohilum turcicum]
MKLVTCIVGAMAFLASAAPLSGDAQQFNPEKRELYGAGTSWPVNNKRELYGAGTSWPVNNKRDADEDGVEAK